MAKIRFCLISAIDTRWRRFGLELRRIRLLSGMTQRQLASRANMSHAMVGSMERRSRTPRREHADILDQVLDTGGTLRQIWNDTVGQRDVPDWFKDALILERRSSEIRTYEPLVVPGVLQTSDYARALVTDRLVKAKPDEVNRIVRIRTERLALIRKNDPLLLFVLRESVFTDIVGDETVMRDQLRHVVALAEEGAIQVQVLPNSQISSIGMVLPFQIMALRDVGSVVYIEHALGWGDLRPSGQRRRHDDPVRTVAGRGPTSRRVHPTHTQAKR